MRSRPRLTILAVALGIILAACQAGTGNPAPTVGPATAAPTAAPATASAGPAVPSPTQTPARPGAQAPAATGSPVAGQGTDGQPWWNDTTFYEVFVRSFADSTGGPLAGDGKGDLQGLIEKLDYLNDGNPATSGDLGVSGLWLMPIFQSPSYHGYDVTDYYTVNQDYGTNEDFSRLIREAHRRGIRVIIDMVFNHTSNQHPWFKQAVDPASPYHEWYIWSAQDPGYRGPWGEQVWHSLGNVYYYGVFDASMPDLNYRNPAVSDEMLKVSRFWLADMGADGFRLDGIQHLIEDGEVQASTPETHAWLRTFRAFYKGLKPESVMVGEVQTTSLVVKGYIGDQLDLAFEFDLANATIGSVNAGTATRVSNAVKLDLNNFPPGQYAPFLTNHDQPRAMTALLGRADAAKLAAAVLLTGPGVPFVYYGEEIGMTGSKPDERLRTPMQWTAGENAGFSPSTPWEPLNPGYEQVNVQSATADPESLLNWYRKLIHLRGEHPALRAGGTVLVDSGNIKVLAFLRQSQSEKALVVLNFDSAPTGDYALKAESSGLAGTLRAQELLGGDQASPPVVNDQGGFAGYKPIPELAPRAAYVIQLAP